MSSISRQQLETWVGDLRVKAEWVLDIGGAQLPVKDRVSQWDVKNYRIMDLSVPHETRVKPDYECTIENRLSINGEVKGQTFDAVFCLEVTEYLINPVSAIFNIFNLTSVGGVLYISFPFFYPAHKPEKTDFLRFTPEGAEKLVGMPGFKIERHDYRYGDGALPALYERYGMKARRGVDHSIIGSFITARKI